VCDDGALACIGASRLAGRGELAGTVGSAYLRGLVLSSSYALLPSMDGCIWMGCGSSLVCIRALPIGRWTRVTLGT
jgi:hypothetical protein